MSCQSDYSEVLMLLIICMIPSPDLTAQGFTSYQIGPHSITICKKKPDVTNEIESLSIDKGQCAPTVFLA